MIEGPALAAPLKVRALAESELRGQRVALRRVATVRGLALTAEQEERIDACGDAAMLGQWIDRMVVAASAEAVFESQEAGRGLQGAARRYWVRVLSQR